MGPAVAAVRYLEPFIGVLLFLSFGAVGLLYRRNLKRWQPKAELLMSLCGMSFCGLVIYIRSTGHTKSLYLAEGFLAGLTLGVFAVLAIEGSIWELGNALKPEKTKEKDRRGAQT